MHLRTHVKAEHRGLSGQDEYSDGMVEHDMHVGELLKLLDELGIANDSDVFNGQRPTLQHLARRRHHALPQREKLELGRRLSCPSVCPLARALPHGHDAERHRRPRRLAPTFAAIAGAPDIKDKLLKGVELNGRSYKNYIRVPSRPR